MKIKNPFHRTTDVERQQKSLKRLQQEKRTLTREVRKQERQIKTQDAKKSMAMSSGDFEKAKEAVFERKAMEKHRGQLKGNIRAVDQVARTVDHVRTQAVIGQSTNGAYKTMQKAMRNAGSTDRVMEKLEELREWNETRQDDFEDMQDSLGMQEQVEAEMCDEIKEMAAQMGQPVVPIQQTAAPVYEEPEEEALEEQ